MSAIPDVLKHLDCAICQNRFNESSHRPKVLHAGHTMCEQCIDKLVPVRQSKVKCPICHELVDKNHASVNHILIEILHQLDQSVEQPGGKSVNGANVQWCNLCLEDETEEPASVRCLDCERFMCEDHIRIHQKRKDKAHHRVVSAVDVAPAAEREPTPPPFDQSNIRAATQQKCKKHPRDVLDRYCQTCQMLICVRCPIIDHQGHENEPIGAALASQRAAIQNLITTSINLHRLHESCVHQLEEEIHSAEVNETTAVEEVTDTLVMIGEMVNHCLQSHETRLHQDIHEIASGQQSALKNQLTSTLSMREQVESATETLQRELETNDFQAIGSSKAAIEAQLHEYEASLRNFKPLKAKQLFFTQAKKPPADALLMSLNIGIREWFASMLLPDSLSDTSSSVSSSISSSLSSSSSSASTSVDEQKSPVVTTVKWNTTAAPFVPNSSVAYKPTNRVSQSSSLNYQSPVFHPQSSITLPVQPVNVSVSDSPVHSPADWPAISPAQVEQLPPAAADWTTVINSSKKPIAPQILVQPGVQPQPTNPSLAAIWPAIMARIRKKPTDQAELLDLVSELALLTSDMQSNLRYLSVYDGIGCAAFLQAHIDNAEVFLVMSEILINLIVLYGAHFENYVMTAIRNAGRHMMATHSKTDEIYAAAYRLVWVLPENQFRVTDLLANQQYHVVAVSFSQREEAEAKQLIQNLCNLPKLRYIDLSNNSLGESGCRLLSENLKFVPHLNQLLLANNKIGEASCINLAANLKIVPKLSQLVLSSNSIGDAGCKALALQFKFIPGLNQLSLTGNNIGDAGVHSLAENFRFIPQLNHLVLSNNRLNTPGCRILGENLKFLHYLSQLALSGCKTGDDGIKFIGQSFKMLKSLIQLALAGNAISDTGLTYLCTHLKHLSSLRQLDLSGNKIGEKGCKSFGATLKFLPAMAQLKIAENVLGDTGVRVLSEQVRHLPSLLMLDIRGNKVSEGAKRSFTESVSNASDDPPVIKA